MRTSISLWPVVIIGLIWAVIAWAVLRGGGDWRLLGVGGGAATALIGFVEAMRLAGARRRQARGGDDSAVWIGAAGSEAGHDSHRHDLDHHAPDSGGHAHGGDSGGSNDGGGGSDGGGGGGGGGD